MQYGNQAGANDCAYWTGYHWPDGGYDTEHTPIGYNSHSHFMWHNWGSGYSDFEVEVERQDNGDGFANKGREDAEILFSGGDYWALVTPSDGTASYWLPVYYDTLH